MTLNIYLLCLYYSILYTYVYIVDADTINDSCTGIKLLCIAENPISTVTFTIQVLFYLLLLNLHMHRDDTFLGRHYHFLLPKIYQDLNGSTSYIQNNFTFTVIDKIKNI